jgi:hypothetical protein
MAEGLRGAMSIAGKDMKVYYLKLASFAAGEIKNRYSRFSHRYIASGATAKSINRNTGPSTHT